MFMFIYIYMYMYIYIYIFFWDKVYVNVYRESDVVFHLPH